MGFFAMPILEIGSPVKCLALGVLVNQAGSKFKNAPAKVISWHKIASSAVKVGLHGTTKTTHGVQNFFDSYLVCGQRNLIENRLFAKVV